MAFDAPSREIVCERRPRSNTPLQALATLNDKSYVECANALARRMLTENNGDAKERAEYGFRLCVSRTPTDKETNALIDLYRQSLEKYRNDSGAAEKLALILGKPKTAMDIPELAAWTVVANVLLNLDESLMKR
jgi:hypothetical protein